MDLYRRASDPGGDRKKNLKTPPLQNNLQGAMGFSDADAFRRNRPPGELEPLNPFGRDDGMMRSSPSDSRKILERIDRAPSPLEIVNEAKAFVTLEALDKPRGLTAIRSGRSGKKLPALNTDNPLGRVPPVPDSTTSYRSAPAPLESNQKDPLWHSPPQTAPSRLASDPAPLQHPNTVTDWIRPKSSDSHSRIHDMLTFGSQMPGKSKSSSCLPQIDSLGSPNIMGFLGTTPSSSSRTPESISGASYRLNIPRSDSLQASPVGLGMLAEESGESGDFFDNPLLAPRGETKSEPPYPVLQPIKRISSLESDSREKQHDKKDRKLKKNGSKEKSGRKNSKRKELEDAMGFRNDGEDMVIGRREEENYPPQQHEEVVVLDEDEVLLPRIPPPLEEHPEPDVQYIPLPSAQDGYAANAAIVQHPVEPGGYDEQLLYVSAAAPPPSEQQQQQHVSLPPPQEYAPPIEGDARVMANELMGAVLNAVAPQEPSGWHDSSVVISENTSSLPHGLTVAHMPFGADHTADQLQHGLGTQANIMDNSLVNVGSPGERSLQQLDEDNRINQSVQFEQQPRGGGEAFSEGISPLQIPMRDDYDSPLQIPMRDDYEALDEQHDTSPVMQSREPRPRTLADQTALAHTLSAPLSGKVYEGNRRSWIRGEMLGLGTLGMVFKAMDVETGETFAVKEVLIDSNLESDLFFSNTLTHEIDILQDLKHDHIVSYLGHDMIENKLYIYLEYMPGGSIAHVVSSYGALDEITISTYTKHVLLGLEFLHSQNPPFLHRDIKGANILVGIDCKAKLSDFGCSKRATDSMTHTVTGSIPWMAPEVMKGVGYGRKADLWSLGCVLIEMSSAHHPWESFDNNLAAMVRIATSDDIPKIPEHISGTCREFIMQCLIRDPDERPNATELLGHPFLRDVPD